MDAKERQDRVAPERTSRTFEPRPRRIDVERSGKLIVERNRRVLDMLEEYDRRQEMRDERKQ